ncbi:MFS transporter [Actinomycetes bacterium M1A6_2h]
MSSTGSAAGTPVPARVSVSASLASVLQPLNSSMIAVAMVAIVTHFGTPDGSSWLISGMYIATAVSAPIGGKLGTIFGARRIYLVGLGIVGIATVVGSTAPDITWLVAAYVLLGMGMATHFPNAMTIIRDYADRHRSDPKSALLTLVLCSQSVAALGPTVGGLLVGTFGWQSILWINIPVIVISAVAVLRYVDRGSAAALGNSRRAVVRSLDLPGVGLFVVLTAGVMMFLLSAGGSLSWYLLVVPVFALLLFIAREWKTAEPFIDVRALARNRSLSATLGRTLLTYVAFYSVFFSVPQWLQYQRGMSATETGLTMLPVAAVGMASTYVASRVLKRYGTRMTLTVGSGALTIGGLLLATVERTTTPIMVVLLVAAVLGVPSGFNNLSNQTMVNNATSLDEVGIAMGMYRTVQFLGANLAAAVLQFTAGPDVGDDGIRYTGWVIVGISAVLLLGVSVTTSLTRGDRSLRE